MSIRFWKDTASRRWATDLVAEIGVSTLAPLEAAYDRASRQAQATLENEAAVKVSARTQLAVAIGEAQRVHDAAVGRAVREREAAQLAAVAATASLHRAWAVAQQGHAPARGAPPVDLEDGDPTACVVCLAAAKTCVLLPCRHLCCCLSCAERVMAMPVKRCPMCRADMASFINVYL